MTAPATKRTQTTLVIVDLYLHQICVRTLQLKITIKMDNSQNSFQQNYGQIMSWSYLRISRINFVTLPILYKNKSVQRQEFYRKFALFRGGGSFLFFEMVFFFQTLLEVFFFHCHSISCFFVFFVFFCLFSAGCFQTISILYFLYNPK